MDGFVFLDAENLVQDQFGAVMDNPPLAEEIAFDPVLRCGSGAVSRLTQCITSLSLMYPPSPTDDSTSPPRDLRLVAAPSDTFLLPRNGVRGFPHWGVWAQWNDRFASDIRAYVEEDQRGRLSAVATRVTGEPPMAWGVGVNFTCQVQNLLRRTF